MTFPLKLFVSWIISLKKKITSSNLQSWSQLLEISLHNVKYCLNKAKNESIEKVLVYL